MRIVIANKEDADYARKYLGVLFRWLSKEDQIGFRKLYTGFPSQIAENKLSNAWGYTIHCLKKNFNPHFKDFPV